MKRSHVGRMPKYLASVGLVLAVTALAGCTSSTTRSQVNAGPTSTSADSQQGATASPSSVDTSSLNCPSPSSSAAGSVATGDDLRKYMPSCNPLDVPSGWLPGYNVVNGPGTDPLAPIMPTAKCDELTGVSQFGLTEDYTATYAKDSLSPPTPTASTSTTPGSATPTVTVEAASYHPGDAVKLLAEVRAYAQRCPSLTGMLTSGVSAAGMDLITIKANPLTGIGDEGIDLTATSSQAGGPSTEAVIVRFGDRILFVTCAAHVRPLPKLMDVATPLANLMHG